MGEIHTSEAVCRDICARLGAKSLVIVGMMGAGKTTVGRRLARKLELPFLDADAEIEAAAGMQIPDIFSIYGEQSFRAGETRVMTRLLEHGPRILATGGGAFLNSETRQRIKDKGLSIWLKADTDVLLKRVKRKNDRPLLLNDDPEAVLRRLMAERDPVYAQADLTVESNETTHERVVSAILLSLMRYFDLGGAA